LETEKMKGMTTLFKNLSMPGRQSANQIADLILTLDRGNKPDGSSGRLNGIIRPAVQALAQDYLQNLRHAYIALESVIGADAHRLSGPSNAQLQKAQSLLHDLILLTNDLVSYATEEEPCL
jgi:hypothetical protein